MKDYSITDGTVTITIDEYTDLAQSYGLLKACIDHSLYSWDNYMPVLQSYRNRETKLSFPELDAYALKILQNDLATDYAYSVALRWLRREQDQNDLSIDDRRIVVTDLSEQLQHLYEEEFVDKNRK